MGIIREYAAEIAATASNIKDLQTAMIDLAEHANQQQDYIDTIESNMSFISDFTQQGNDQITQGASRQQTSSKWFTRTVVLVGFLCALILICIIIAVRKH